jgi:hypothetical protein
MSCGGDHVLFLSIDGNRSLESTASHLRPPNFVCVRFFDDSQLETVSETNTVTARAIIVRNPGS